MLIIDKTNAETIKREIPCGCDFDIVILEQHLVRFVVSKDASCSYIQYFDDFGSNHMSYQDTYKIHKSFNLRKNIEAHTKVCLMCGQKLIQSSTMVEISNNNWSFDICLNCD